MSEEEEASNGLLREGRLTTTKGKTRGNGIAGWKVRGQVEGKGLGVNRRYSRDTRRVNRTHCFKDVAKGA